MNNEKGSGKGKRLSKQNYCSFCVYREKTKKGTICKRYNTSINDANQICSLLKPFDEFKKHKEEKAKK